MTAGFFAKAADRSQDREPSPTDGKSSQRFSGTLSALFRVARSNSCAQ
jgi:hypothetical protein